MPDDAGARISPGGDTAAETRARLIARLRDAPARSRLADAAHRIAGRPPLGALSGLLDEIDATVMARTLVVRGEVGELRLEVCNRRLLNAWRPGDGGARHTLTNAGGAELHGLRQDLDRALSGAGARLYWERPEGSAMLDQTGMSAQMLRQAWEGEGEAVVAKISAPARPASAPPAPDPSVPAAPEAPSRPLQAQMPDPATPGDPVARLCDGMAPSLIAGLLLTGDGETPLAGAPEAIAALRRCVQADGAGVLVARDAGPRLTILTGAPDAALLAIACSDRSVAILTLPQTDGARLHAAWAAGMSRDPPLHPPGH